MEVLRKRKRKLHFKEAHGERQCTGWCMLWPNGNYTMTWRAFRRDLGWLYDMGDGVRCLEGAVDVLNYNGETYALSIPRGDFDVD